jgi:hypothetical protein
MGISRYIIWTTSLEDTNNIMEILNSHSSIIVSVTDSILCVESKLTPARIRGYVGDDMEMACLEIDDAFITKLMKTKFKEDEKKNFSRFLRLTDAPTTIDEALDLINHRGGLEYLSDREISALDRLTNKY